jgi:HD superfamily phosphodiesterase
MIKNTMSFLTKLFNYVLLASAKYNIDESHGLSHSMNVLQFASELYQNELPKHSHLEDHERIIYASAVLHDMCDKKYMNEIVGLLEIEDFLRPELEPFEIGAVKQIISTMSYSTVKKNGFPNLGIYQNAYNIVREADLLAAYDFDRTMIYQMKRNNNNIEEAFKNSNELFENRVLKHIDDNLITSNYGIKKALLLQFQATKRIVAWKKLLNK